MKNSIILFAFLLLLLDSNAQQVQYPGSSSEDYSNSLESTLLGFEYNNPVKGYKGEQYFGYWNWGEIELKNGDVIKNIVLRYDKYLDQLLWMRKKDSKIGIVAKDAVASFRLYKDEKRIELLAVFRYKRVSLNGLDTTKVFLQELADGDPGLYVYRNVKIVSSTEYNLDESPLYFICNVNKIYRVSLRRRSLLKCPAIDKTRMKPIIRAEGFLFNQNEQAMAHVIKSYQAKQAK